MKLEKGKEVTPDVLIEAFNAMEDELTLQKGAVGKIEPFIAQFADFTKRFDEAASRMSQGGLEPKFSKDDIAKGGFEILHKMPSGIRRHAGGLGWDAPQRSEDPIGWFQDIADKLYIIAAQKKRLNIDGTLSLHNVKNLKFYTDTFHPALVKMQTIAKEAFDTLDAGAGLEWVPTEVSTRLIERVRLELKVAAMFEEIIAPRGKMDLPCWLADLTMYRVAQRVGDPYTVDSTARVSDMLGSTNFTGKISFDAEKLGGIVFVSKEQEEDSIIPMLPILDRALIQAGKDAIENSVINGSAAANLDNDVSATTDVRTAYAGLREYALVTSTASKDATGAAINEDAKWNTYVRGVKGLMGKFGVDPSKLFRIVSPIVENQIGSCPKFATLYAFGGLATNQGGAAINGFKPDGIPLIVSEFQRDDVSANGKNTALGPNNLSTVLTAHRDGWANFTVRQMRIELLQERWAEYDMDGIKITMRRDFQALQPGNHVGITYQVSTAE